MNMPHISFGLSAEIFYDSQNEKTKEAIENALKKLLDFKNPNRIGEFTPLTVDNERYYLIKEGKMNIIFQNKKDEFLINDIVSGSVLSK